MPAALKCPTCSAPLDLPPGHATAVECRYCGAGVLLHERLGAMEALGERSTLADTVGEVVRLLRAGQRFDAIRLYQERLGSSLDDAVGAVLRIESGQPAGSVPPAAPVGKVIRAAVLLAGVGIIGAMFALRGGTTPADDAGEPGFTRTPATPAAAAPGDAFAAEALAFGSEGTGAGRFEDARSVAVDGQGRIYVAEYQGGRVQVFDSAGTFLTQWRVESPTPVLDLAADRAGTVYAVTGGGIARFAGADGTPRDRVPGPDADGYSDVAVALDGSLWATTIRDRLVHLSATGERLASVDLAQAVDGDARATRIAVAGDGTLYVLNRWSAEVYRLTPDGRFTDRFGGRGDAPGQLNNPTDLALDGRGRLYVSDLGRGIHVFTPEGNYLDSFGGTSVVFGMAITNRDELFAAYRNRHQVVKFRLPQAERTAP